MKSILTAFAILVSATLFAQNTLKEDVDIIQGIYGKSKKELAVSFMNVPPASAEAFWKLYDEYEAERKALGHQKVVLINDYAKHFDALTEAKADELAKGTLENNMDYEKLYSKYYEKIKPVIGAIGAARFMQLEIYLQTIVRVHIQDEVPFIYDMEGAKTKK